MCCAAYVTLFAEVGQDSDLAIERLNSHQRAYFTWAYSSEVVEKSSGVVDTLGLNTPRLVLSQSKADNNNTAAWQGGRTS
jgi:hypothetical protein